MLLNLRKNTALALLEALFTTAIYFLLFRLVIASLGISQLGVWSLVSAAASIARVGDLGLSAGVNRFVAAALAQGMRSKARDVIDTALIAMAALYTSVSVIIYPIAYFTLPKLLGGESLSAARHLLPFSIVTLIVYSSAGVLSSSLSGLQLSYRKSMINIFSLLFMLLISAVLIKAFGLVGLGIAQIMQAIAVAVSSWTILQIELPGSRTVPRWSAASFSEILAYGAQVQLGSIAALAFEPLVKIVMAKFGGLSDLALYEVALRLVTQVRNLVVSANQSLISAFAALYASNSPRLRALYDRSIRLTSIACLAMIAAIGFGSLAVSEVIFHTFTLKFLSFCAMLGVAQSINVLGTPAYMLGLGIGKVRYNLLSHIIMTASSPCLGALAGRAWGATGVVAGVSIGLILGAIILYIGHVRYFRNLFPRGLAPA